MTHLTTRVMLDAEHTSGEKSIHLLGHVLLGFEIMGEPRRQTFSANRDPFTRHEPKADYPVHSSPASSISCRHRFGWGCQTVRRTRSGHRKRCSVVAPASLIN